MPKHSRFRCPCYGGKTIITVMNEITKKIEKVSVSDLIAGVHLVYSIDKSKFIPLAHVAKIGTLKRIMVIRTVPVSEENPKRKSPLNDIYLTKNVRMLSQGRILRMRDVPGAEKLKIDPEPRYVLVTSDPEFIMVSGVAVQTRGLESFESYLRRHDCNPSVEENLG